GTYACEASRCGYCWIFEAIAELLDRGQRRGQERDLLAQATDVHVDGPRAAGVLVAPHIGEQEIAREHPAAVFDQILQQQELLRGQAYLRAIDRDDVPLEIDDDRTVSQRAGAGR